MQGIPSRIAQYFFTDISTNITLVDEYLNEFPATVHNWSHFTRITYGWKDFVDTNMVEVGDTVSLELVDYEERVWKVRVFKA